MAAAQPQQQEWDEEDEEDEQILNSGFSHEMAAHATISLHFALVILVRYRGKLRACPKFSVELWTRKAS